MCNVCVLTRDAYPCHLETLLLGTSTAAASCCMYDWLSRGGNQAERRQLHFIVRVGLLPTAVYRLRLLLRPSTSTVMCMQCIPAVYGRRRRARRWWSNKCGRIGCIYDRLKVQYKCCMLAIYYLRLSSSRNVAFYSWCRLPTRHQSLFTRHLGKGALRCVEMAALLRTAAVYEYCRCTRNSADPKCLRVRRCTGWLPAAWRREARPRHGKGQLRRRARATQQKLRRRRADQIATIPRDVWYINMACKIMA